MNSLVDYYSKYAHAIISEGYVKGGIEALKEKFPEGYRDMEDKLKKNFTKQEIDLYCKNMIAGLRKVGFWND
jgi:hypothetical protein